MIFFMTERDFTYDPSRMRDELHEVLREASFAASIGSHESIRSLTRLESDVEIWERDLEVMDSLFTYSSITRLGLGKSLLAPVAKMLSRRELREVTASIKPATRVASAKRTAHSVGMARASDSGTNERAWLDHRTPQAYWPKRNDSDLTPLQVALSTSPCYAVSLSAYQWEAVGIIETVRAAGRVIGKRDADTLANQFQLMILAYGGIETAHIDDISGLQEVKLRKLIDNDSLVRGGFIQSALDGTVFNLEPFSALESLVRPSGRGWWPLTGPDQMLAVTILAAWLRMSRFGVRLSAFETLEQWSLFFDGTHYGYVPELVGRAWLLNHEDNLLSSQRYTFFENWTNEIDPPWLCKRGGSPMIFVGIAGKLLTEAIRSVSVLDKIPDEFTLPESDDLASVEGFRESEITGDYDPQPDRQLLELRRLRDRLISAPSGCAYEVRLLDHY